MPGFYSSYWPYYPDIQQFRKAFIVERARQYEIVNSLERVEKKYKYLLSDNPACVGRMMKHNYIPKPTDTPAIQQLQTVTSVLLANVEKIDSTLESHDDSLFLLGGRKLKSGRRSMHDFNSNKRLTTVEMKLKLQQLDKELEQKKELCESVWAEKKTVSEAKKRKNNEYKTEKRRKFSALKQALQLHRTLNGQCVGDAFTPEEGIPQITDLPLPLSDLPRQNLLQSLKTLLKAGCLRGKALEEAELFLEQEEL